MIKLGGGRVHHELPLMNIKPNTFDLGVINTLYNVCSIKKIDQLKDCPTFLIDQHQWEKNDRPQAFGQMALLEDYGFIITMTAMERNPLRRYTQDNDPVYKDSGLEAFLNFAPESLDERYLNFEMNANGALLSQFGNRGNREKVNILTSYRTSCTAYMEENSWHILLKIPMELICDLYSIKPLKINDTFTCNFYKISEDASIEHYASYAPIDSPKPDFHLPQFFAKAIIVRS